MATWPDSLSTRPEAGSDVAECTVIYWRDIPAQVIVKAGRRQARRQLDERFQEAIDRAAMRAGLFGTDDYLSEWRRSTPESCGDDIEAEADAAKQRLEAEFDTEVLSALVADGGSASTRDL